VGPEPVGRSKHHGNEQNASCAIHYAPGLIYTAERHPAAPFVALKFLTEWLAKDPAALERFQREAQAASALNLRQAASVYRRKRKQP
jgi:hypothetical protein